MARNVLDLKQAGPRPESQPVVSARTDAEVLASLRAAVQDDPPPRPAPPASPGDEEPPADLAPLRVHPLDAFRRSRTRLPQAPEPPDRGRGWRGLLSLVPWVLGAGLVIAGLLYVSQYGLSVRDRVMERGMAAIAGLMAARDDIAQWDWAAAREHLAAAHDDLEEASGTLEVLGPEVTTWISKIPGLYKLRVGRDVLNAGRLMTDSGLVIADALTKLEQVSAAAGSAKDVSLFGILTELDDALGKADAGVAESSRILETVPDDQVPPEMLPDLMRFRQELPAIVELLDRMHGALAFVRAFSGEDGPQRYLVLFQNSSELRPTGGFPGTYGLLTMEKGRVTDWRADDIYNPDGQIKDTVVPPLQLQGVTPWFGMRDANWWADWSVSAPKVAAYWQRGGGAAVDGVLAIEPAVLRALLAATGPIELPDYGVTVNEENFLALLQQEVEEQRPTGKPKQVISDLAPVVLDRLATLPGSAWVGVLGDIAESLDNREALVWFADEDMQAFADSEGWTGRVRTTEGDFLMPVIANIGGAKTDAVTANRLKLESRVVDGTLVHRLTLTRTNNGDESPHGFYNHPNKAFIRILVPKGSTLRGIRGMDAQTPKPLMTYVNAAGRDGDVQALEATMRTDPQTGITVFEESGKTAYGFWLTVPPGEERTVQLEYAVPASAFSRAYSFLFQKQPGLNLENFELTLDKPGLMVASSESGLTEWDDSWRLVVNDPGDVAVSAVLR